jgi:hypothetical protein
LTRKRSERPRRTPRSIFLPLLLCSSFATAADGSDVGCPGALAAAIPARSSASPEGAQFARQISRGETKDRERAIETELLRGNLPDFLRELKPVTLESRLPSGRTVTATICVLPDYLAVGSDEDFLRIPMDLHTATSVAGRFGFALPTRKMVDAIYAQSDAKLAPEPMTAGPQMSSTAYYVTHNDRISAQRAALDAPPGALLAGHKKDVVLTSRLASQAGKIAIYGWHRRDGRPIQPLSTVHGSGYADYSHGIRLVSGVVFVDGEATSLAGVLRDPELAPLLSDEGPLPDLGELMPAAPTPVAGLKDALAKRARTAADRPARRAGTSG